PSPAIPTPDCSFAADSKHRGEANATSRIIPASTLDQVERILPAHHQNLLLNQPWYHPFVCSPRPKARPTSHPRHPGKWRGRTPWRKNSLPTQEANPFVINKTIERSNSDARYKSTL